MSKQQEEILDMISTQSQRATDLLALCVKAQTIMLNDWEESRKVSGWGQERDDMKAWLVDFKNYLERQVSE